MEPLEDRTVPSTFTVLNLHDGGPDSLRAAIVDANADPDADTVRFAGGLTGTISLASQLSITEDLTIDGPGAGKVTVSGGNATRVFSLSGGGTDVTIAGLTIAQGRADQGAGIDNAAGSLIVAHCVLSHNQAVAGVGADAMGGAIFNQAGATLTVTHSTLSDNQAHGGDGGDGGGGPGGDGVGGALENQGTAGVDQSTFTDNLAQGGETGPGGFFAAFGGGGGIDNEHGGILSVSHSTLTGNRAVGGVRHSGDNCNRDFRLGRRSLLCHAVTRLRSLTSNKKPKPSALSKSQVGPNTLRHGINTEAICMDSEEK
jgi:hypothetical protein